MGMFTILVLIMMLLQVMSIRHSQLFDEKNDIM